MPTTLITTLDVHDDHRVEQITARLTQVLTDEFGINDPHISMDAFPAPREVLPVPADHESHGDPTVLGLCPNPSCTDTIESISLRVWEYSEHDYHPKHGPSDSDYSHTYNELLCCHTCGQPITLDHSDQPAPTIDHDEQNPETRP